MANNDERTILSLTNVSPSGRFCIETVPGGLQKPRRRAPAEMMCRTQGLNSLRSMNNLNALRTIGKDTYHISNPLAIHPAKYFAAIMGSLRLTGFGRLRLEFGASGRFRVLKSSDYGAVKRLERRPLGGAWAGGLAEFN